MLPSCNARVDWDAKAAATVAGTLTATPAAAARPMLLWIGNPISIITILVRMPPPIPAKPEDTPIPMLAIWRNKPPGGWSATGLKCCGK